MRFRPPLRLLFLVIFQLAILAEDSNSADQRDPLDWDLGSFDIRPGGFLDWISMARSQTTPDGVYTHFNRIPLRDTPGEALTTLGHSRGWVKSTTQLGDYSLAGYYEFDLMNPNPGIPFRLRQAWGEVRWRRWSVLAGRAWSQLRSNRTGLASDTGVMNTDVVEPAYHIGIVGSRRTQIRLTNQGEHWGTAISIERRTEGTGTDVLWRVMRETDHLHLEGTALAGGGGRRALNLAGTIPIAPRLRLVSQNYIARRAAYEALSIIPAGISGGATLQGLESHLPRGFELYTYGGLVYGAPSKNNRIAREWTIGGSKKLPAPGGYGTITTGLQFSQMDRQVWRSGSGQMTYLQIMLRYTLW